MKDYTTEADARILVDELLRRAGWNPADKSQVITEFSVRENSSVTYLGCSHQSEVRFSDIESKHIISKLKHLRF